MGKLYLLPFTCDTAILTTLPISGERERARNFTQRVAESLTLMATTQPSQAKPSQAEMSPAGWLAVSHAHTVDLRRQIFRQTGHRHLPCSGHRSAPLADRKSIPQRHLGLASCSVFIYLFILQIHSLRCFDTVGWASGRVICSLFCKLHISDCLII